MKTDDLVALLSTSLEPVDRRSVVRTLCVALAAGSIVSLGLTLVGLGVRPDLITARALIFLVVKLFFAVGIVSLALVYLTRLARPGGGSEKPRRFWSQYHSGLSRYFPSSALGSRPAPIGTR